MGFDLVKEAVMDAEAIAWDTCHKIYILMDEEQVEEMRGYGYKALITRREATSREMFETIRKWWDDSCSLRFVESIATNKEDPNKGFEALIAQGEEIED
jgi:hypothetical protein